MAGKTANASGKKEKTPSKARRRSKNADTAPEAMPLSTPTPRKRRLASDFASKKPSTRKRKKSRPEAEKGDIDELLHGLRGLAEGNEDGPEDLRAAFARAKDAFEQDDSGSSSLDEDNDIVMDSKTGKSGKADSLNAKSTTGILKTPKKGPQAKPVTPPNTGAVAKTPSRRQKEKTTTPAKEKGYSKKGHNHTSQKKTSAFISKTASAHKADIEALKRDDPEFHKFLQENDPTLLDFSTDDEDSIAEDENDGDYEAVVENGGDEDEDDRNEHSSDDSADNSNEDEEEDESVPSTGAKVAGRRNSIAHDKSGEAKEKDHLITDVKRSTEEGLDNDNSSTSGDEESDGIRVEERSKGVVHEDDDDDSDDDSDDGSSDGSDRDDDSDRDEEDEERAEAEAAAEAGLDLNGHSDSEVEGNSDDEEAEDAELKKEEGKTLILVDMSYLRNVREQLKSNRSSLKAAKELMRLFRAGKDILPTSAGTDDKGKVNKKKSRKTVSADVLDRKEVEEMEEDQFADDGSFTSGKVRFVSAKAYQQAMNLAITGVQDALDRMLGKPVSKKEFSKSQAKKWDPSESSRWSNLQPLFRSFVYHMLSLCDSVVDAQTVRFLLKRLERLVPYTKSNKVLLKKLIKTAIQVWSSDGLHVSEATRLRSYLLLNRIAHGPGNAEAVLRSCCSVYASKIAGVCNPRTLSRIQFAISCLVELFGIDMGASYTTAFSNLRELAVTLRAVLVSKDEKEEVERIHNWSYVNQLRLWSRLLGKYGSEDELEPLMYPYVQITLGVMRVHATPKTIPLRLHLASYLSDLVEQTGIFIPLTPHVLGLLRCSELRKKPIPGSSKPLEWRSLLRVSDEAIKSKPFLTGVVNGVILQLAKFFAVVSKHVAFPELSHMAQATLKKFSKECKVKEWNTKVTSLVEKLRQTSEMVAKARAKANFSPKGAVSAEGMLAVVPGLDPDLKMPVQRLYEVESTRVEKEEKLRDEKATAPGQIDKDINMDDSEDEHMDDSAEEDHSKRKNKVRKSLSEKARLPTSIINTDEEEDRVEDLSIDSDESDE